jgi:hypothetical protein
MRVIFLDFGGVTHPCGVDDEARAAHRGGATGGVRLDVFCWFDILPGLLAGHDDVYVVVHSNWRFAHSEQEIGDLLGDLGHRYLGCTPLGERYACIQAWLTRHPTVSSYRILDDSPVARPHCFRRHRLHRPPGGRVPASDLRRCRGSCVGPSPGEMPPSSRGARCHRGARHSASAHRGCVGCRRAGRPGGAHACDPDHRRPVPTPWRNAGARLRAGWHRLCRPVRRAGLDGEDDSPPAADGRAERRPYRLLLRLRFDPLRPRRAVPAGRGAAPLRSSPVARARTRAGAQGRAVRWHHR